MLEESSLPLAGAWDEALLAPVAEINERALESLHHLALLAFAPEQDGGRLVHDAASPAAERRSLQRPIPPLLLALGEEWRALDATLQRRVAGCPYLLIDAGFGPGGPWEQPLQIDTARANAPWAYFCGSEGIALERRALLLAWHLARSNRLGARVLLGMSAPAAERIAACRLQDLDALAEQLPAWIVPRWETQPSIWRQLLRAARSGQPTRLQQAQLRGVQLLAAAVRNSSA